MKLAESLYERKKIESKILKLMDYRKAIYNKTFPTVDDESLERTEKRYDEFLSNLKKRIDKINKEIDDLTEKYVEIAHSINEKNLELELDKQLLRMKFVRLELSSLNNIRKSRLFDSFGDLERLEGLNIESRLDKIEEKKRKLDSHIQKLNQVNNITL